MKKHFIWGAAALMALVSCANEPAFEQTEEVGPFTVSLIEENVWHVEDCTADYPHGMSTDADGKMRFKSSSDMYIVRGKKAAILIDLSNNITYDETADESLRNIFYSRAGKREKLITVTHNHGDHTGMYKAFKDEAGVKFLLAKDDFQNDTVFVEKTLFEDRHSIDLGGETIDCVECQGHTPGSMVFFLKGHNIAFSGDAIGSGTGVWLFNMECFDNYVKGIENLLSYIEDPESGIDPATFMFWGGHTYQNSGFTLGVQTVRQAKELNEQILAGTAEWEPYSMAFRGLDATFKNGQAMVVWNKALSEEVAARTKGEAE